MDYYLGRDWDIAPAGGATGEAFVASHKKQKLFLKRNSSPFLAVLSAEGIVPKLVWTKRLENGDVISAQEWLMGRELTASEMNNETVAELLQKIHRSKPLLSMLQRMGKTALSPNMILTNIHQVLDEELHVHPSIREVLHYLDATVEDVEVSINTKVVCHGDINHNNWLLSDKQQLYLIDWDEAVIADPAIDIGMLLYNYIPKENWKMWTSKYGVELTDELKLRMKWYVLSQTIHSIIWHKEKSRFHEMNRYLEQLKKAQEY